MINKIKRLASRVFSAVMKLANTSIHRDILSNRELRIRGRTLFLSAYAYMALLLLLSPLIFMLDIPNFHKVVLISVCLIQLLCFSLVIYWLQVSGYYKPAVHLMLLSMSAWVLFGIFVTGGPSLSPVLELMLFLPVIVFYLLGIKKGLSWTGFNLLILAGLFLLDWQNYTFKNVIPDPLRLEISALIYLVGFISISIMIFIYENTFVGLQAQQQKGQAQTRFLATHDKLTGIANRTFFYSELDASFAKAKLSKTSNKLALLYMDLVGFKEVNDTHGHHVGDSVLQQIAKNLEEGIRGTDLVARHGGDEFVILLRSVKDSESIEFLANKIANIVSQPIVLEDIRLQVFPSMGIAFYPEHASDLVALEKLADAAMYQAKAQRKNWQIHDGPSSSARFV